MLSGRGTGLDDLLRQMGASGKWEFFLESFAKMGNLKESYDDELRQLILWILKYLCGNPLLDFISAFKIWQLSACFIFTLLV